ncbi:helix-turn-helix domain-containing protein [Herminiimonas sp. CN]|uniref:helix-turn-helix domain-containing protein n=1 Tax=Herminiimonas sp. CN TaxID=1349818 RepID=UPI00047340BE|nr:cupin domain-containing protein [Herminiimonas sp. CN]
MNHPNPDSATLGALIRDLRKRKGFTLQELAGRIGRSVGFMSQIERGLSQPTVEDLNVIEKTLGVPTTYFFPKAEASACAWVTRPSERRTLSYARGVIDHLVSPDLSNRFCMLETVMEPGSDTGERHIMDSSEQAGYVLEGQLTMLVDGEQRTLEPGDAFHFRSGTPCRYSNLGTVRTKVLWIFS